MVLYMLHLAYNIAGISKNEILNKSWRYIKATCALKALNSLAVTKEGVKFPRTPFFSKGVFFPSFHSHCIFFHPGFMTSSYLSNNSQWQLIHCRIKTKHVTWNSWPFCIWPKPLIFCNSTVHPLLQSGASEGNCVPESNRSFLLLRAALRERKLGRWTSRPPSLFQI